ncbi:MAG: hypothetical protein ACYCYP_14055 [Leptospirales bacterium]
MNSRNGLCDLRVRPDHPHGKGQKGESEESQSERDEALDNPPSTNETSVVSY